MLRSLHEVLRAPASSVPALYCTAAADELGDAIDTAGFGAREAVFYIGNAGDTWSSTDKIVLVVQDSDDDGGTDPYADVAAGYIDGTLASLESSSADDNQEYRYGLRPQVKRYVKLGFNASGTHTTGTIMSSAIILGEALDCPTDNP